MKQTQLISILLLIFTFLFHEANSACPCSTIDTITWTGRILNRIEKAKEYDNCRQRIGVFVNPENIKQYKDLKIKNIDSLTLEEYDLLRFYRTNVFEFQKEANYNANICSDSLLNMTLVSPRLKEYIEMLKNECNEMQRDVKNIDSIAKLNNWNNYSEEIKKPIFITNIRNNGNRYLRSSLIVLAGGILSGLCEYYLINTFNTNLWNEGNYSLAIIGVLGFGAVMVFSIPGSITLFAIGKTRNNKVLYNRELIKQIQNGEMPIY